MNNHKCALAIFVKSPELSPIKTRLAATIGKDLAIDFYEHSLRALIAMVKKLQLNNKNLTIFWAIAEKEGMELERWSEFTNIFQGDGELGERLGHVYEQLQNNFSAVALIGADAAHLPLSYYQMGIELIQNHGDQKYILGETTDGGFYFFGSKKPIPKELWLQIPYSCIQTSSELKKIFSAFGEICNLPRGFDIDTIEDLSQYTQIRTSTSDLMNEQQELLMWPVRMKISQGK